MQIDETIAKAAVFADKIGKYEKEITLETLFVRFSFALRDFDIFLGSSMLNFLSYEFITEMVINNLENSANRSNNRESCSLLCHYRSEVVLINRLIS